MSRKIFALELQAYTNITLFYNKVYFMMYICKKSLRKGVLWIDSSHFSTPYNLKSSEDIGKGIFAKRQELQTSIVSYICITNEDIYHQTCF